MKPKTWADAIVSRVCNEHRNSDLRADNPDVIKALNSAHDADMDAAIVGAEVWFEVESSYQDADDWYRDGVHHETRSSADENIDMRQARSSQYNKMGFVFRVVRVTVTREVVE
jgi:hypothetical protein